MIRTLITTLALTLILPIYAHAWRLVWDVPTGGDPPSGYLVEISDDRGATWRYIYAADTNELALDDKCGFNQTYQFRVSAFNDAGISQPTAPIEWTRPAYTPPPESTLPPVNQGPQPPTTATVTEN